MLQSIGRLWLSGVEIHWEKLPQAKQRRRIPLPTYPFERQLYWMETGRVVGGSPCKRGFHSQER